MQKKSPLKSITAALTVLLLLTSCTDTSDNPPVYQTGFIAMDTYISFTVYGENAEKAAKAAQKETERLESLLSVTDPDSEVSKINAANGQPVDISDDTANIIHLGLLVGSYTGGALDITLRPVVREWGFTTGDYKVPSDETLKKLLEKVDYKSVDYMMNLTERRVTLPEGVEIDLGAIAKGYAGDKAVDILRENGITSALVNLGGNVQTLGAKPDGEKWRVAVRNPFDESNLGALEIENAAVVTSGGYERYFEDENGVRYHHIIDPSTGYPADSGAASVTVVGENGRLCDALSTAMFVMGSEDAAGLYRSLGNFDMILVTEGGRILITEGIAESFENWSDMEVEIIEK